MIPKSLFRYLLVGVTNTLVGYGVILFVQLGLGVHAIVANALGYFVGLVVSYWLNRVYTFRSTQSHAKSIPTFVAVAGMCYVLNLAVLQLTIGYLGLSASIAQGLAICSYTIAFFVASRYLVFKNNGDGSVLNWKDT
jgi:putative flippase GtrA